MNILYLHQYFNTPDMAGGTRSFELARRLVELGHCVHMVTSDRGRKGRGWRQSVESGINVHWSAVPYDNGMSYAARLRAFVQFATRASSRAASLRADVVFASSTPLTIVLPALYAARRLRIPIVFEVRDLWPAVPIAMGAIKNPFAIRAALWLEQLAYQNSRHIIALAPGMKDHVVAKGVPAERVTVIPNGSDVEIFAKAAGTGAEIRARHEWLRARPMVLYCGAIGRVNGVDYLARVAASVYPRNPEIRFVVIGKGSEERRLRDLAAELGVLGKTFFVLGAIAKKDVPSWLDAADVSVALINGPRILWEHSTQNKFFDALAAGRPVLSNFRGWQSIIAEAAGAGAILDGESIETAAGQLVRLLADKEWLVAAGRAARKMAVEQFDRNQQALVLERVLADAVSNK